MNDEISHAQILSGPLTRNASTSLTSEEIQTQIQKHQLNIRELKNLGSAMYAELRVLSHYRKEKEAELRYLKELQTSQKSMSHDPSPTSVCAKSPHGKQKSSDSPKSPPKKLAAPQIKPSDLYLESEQMYQQTDFSDIRYQPDLGRFNRNSTPSSDHHIIPHPVPPFNPETFRLSHYPQSLIHLVANEKNTVYYGESLKKPPFRLDHFQILFENASLGYPTPPQKCTFKNGIPISRDGERVMVHMKGVCSGLVGTYTNVFRGRFAFQPLNCNRPDAPAVNDNEVGEQQTENASAHDPIDAENYNAPPTSSPSTNNQDPLLTPNPIPSKNPPKAPSGFFYSGKGPRHHILMTGALDPRDRHAVRKLAEQLKKARAIREKYVPSQPGTASKPDCGETKLPKTTSERPASPKPRSKSKNPSAATNKTKTASRRSSYKTDNTTNAMDAKSLRPKPSKTSTPFPLKPITDTYTRLSDLNENGVIDLFYLIFVTEKELQVRFTIDSKDLELLNQISARRQKSVIKPSDFPQQKALKLISIIKYLLVWLQWGVWAMLLKIVIAIKYPLDALLGWLVNYWRSDD